MLQKDGKSKTKNEAKIIHGASDVDRSPLYDGLWATTMTYAPVSHLKELVRSSKKMKGKIIPDVVRESVTEYESVENMNMLLTCLRTASDPEANPDQEHHHPKHNRNRTDKQHQ